MRDQAIRNTHPTVVSINADIDARDAAGQTVVLDEAAIAAEIIKLHAAHAASQYRRDRANAYPAIGDQLDALFHAGVFPAEMAAQLQAVKDAHPKGI